MAKLLLRESLHVVVTGSKNSRGEAGNGAETYAYHVKQFTTDDECTRSAQSILRGLEGDQRRIIEGKELPGDKPDSEGLIRI